MRELTNDKIQELVELVGHGSVSVKHRNQKIREWIAINTRPNDAKAMIAGWIENMPSAEYVSLMKDMATRLQNKGKDDAPIEDVIQVLWEVCKQSSEGEEG